MVIIVGATGTGKSKLSVHLASRYKAELINSDKMQVYKGPDIVTNKVTCGTVPHCSSMVTLLERMSGPL